ncbi:MAG TPA: hypothetical protein VMV20_02950 [Chitinophagaceae bacterium]|nr:hypothetical protein [Chitinophagaceae bacterium]
MNRNLPLIGLSALVLIPSLLVAQTPSGRLFGFRDSDTAAQFSLERRFDANLRPEDQDRWMKRLSAYPHNVGSAYDFSNALYIDSLYKSWGFESHIETFDVLYPTPLVRKLEMISPKPFEAILKEIPVPGDPTSSQTDLQLPTYNI